MNPFSSCPMTAHFPNVHFLTSLVLVAVMNLTNSLTALAQMATTTEQGYATEHPVQTVPTGLRANVHQVDGPLKFKVNYENPKGGLVEIRILDQKGLILQKNLFLNTPRKVTVYDLSALEDGLYTFEVSTLLEKYSKSYDIQRKTVRSVTPVQHDQTDERLTLYKQRQPDKP